MSKQLEMRSVSLQCSKRMNEEVDRVLWRWKRRLLVTHQMRRKEEASVNSAYRRGEGMDSNRRSWHSMGGARACACVCVGIMWHLTSCVAHVCWCGGKGQKEKIGKKACCRCRNRHCPTRDRRSKGHLSPPPTPFSAPKH